MTVTINFKRYINTTILVSMPTLFHDSKCRPFKLLGVELPGVWLQSDELTTRLLPDQMQQYATAGPAVFVPFAHIAGILVPTARPATTTPAPSPAPATTTPAPAAAATTPNAAPVKGDTSTKARTPKTKTS
ncbi:MAG: hypothetical protein ACLPX9_06555 [Rhodomicrobium sp.]